MLLLDAELSNGPYAAREARRHVSALGPKVPERVLPDLTLLVSELVTNSYRHAGLSDDDAIRLRVLLDEGTLRIEVLDRGTAGNPSIKGSADEGGWGLQIVEQLADRWGTEKTPGGTTVWFELQAV